MVYTNSHLVSNTCYVKDLFSLSYFIDMKLIYIYNFVFVFVCFFPVFAPGGASAAEVGGGQHETDGREESLGSFSEHSRTGAAGGAAADPDATGQKTHVDSKHMFRVGPV